LTWFDFLKTNHPGKNSENFRVFQVKRKVVKGKIAQKNSENFDILRSHNPLQARSLQKQLEASIYDSTEMGKAKQMLKAEG
jgi:hypothetical protein